MPQFSTDTYILATSFFGLACSLFFSDSDAPLLLVAFFSVGLIFLSGVSYPLELMPWYWQWIHYMVPAAPGTLAFVKINSMGASMSEISQQYIILWIQWGNLQTCTTCSLSTHTHTRSRAIARMRTL